MTESLPFKIAVLTNNPSESIFRDKNNCIFFPKSKFNNFFWDLEAFIDSQQIIKNYHAFPSYELVEETAINFNCLNIIKESKNYNPEEWILVCNEKEGVTYSDSFFAEVSSIVNSLASQRNKIELVLLSGFSEEASKSDLDQNANYFIHKNILPLQEGALVSSNFCNNNMTSYLIKKKLIIKMIKDKKRISYLLHDLKCLLPLQRTARLKKPLIKTPGKVDFNGPVTYESFIAYNYRYRFRKNLLVNYQNFFLAKFPQLYNRNSKGKLLEILSLLHFL